MQLHRVAGSVRLQTRCASTTSNTYPFPTYAQPTPHDIFHLPRGASQQDIKRRYYDLVRLHHPDSIACAELSSADRNARFQAIMSAYDSLRGKTSHHYGRSDWGVYADEIERRRRAQERKRERMRRRPEHAAPPRYAWESNADDRWKDKMIITFGVVALALGIAPGLVMLPYRMHERHRRSMETAQSYSEVRTEAQEEADGRRQGVRDRLKQMRDAEPEA